MTRSKILILAMLLICVGLCSCTTDHRKQIVAAEAPRIDSPHIPLNYLPTLKGDYFRLNSLAVNRPYHIYVRLPEGYDPAKPEKYPVVYLLDGDSLFPLLAPTHIFLNYDEQIPEAVLVGIAYGGLNPAVNKRNIDFSALGDDTSPGEGGASRFLQFLRHELLPEVERRYRIDPAKRVLLGQSRAGYFVLWSALEDPDLFWARIASNPSFTPARNRLFTSASTHEHGDLNLILASGTRDSEVRMSNALEWTKFWKARTDAPWTIRHLIIQGGTHAASIGEAYRQAMTWLFREDIARAPAKK